MPRTRSSSPWTDEELFAADQELYDADKGQRWPAAWSSLSCTWKVAARRCAPAPASPGPPVAAAVAAAKLTAVAAMPCPQPLCRRRERDKDIFAVEKEPEEDLFAAFKELLAKAKEPRRPAAWR